MPNLLVTVKKLKGKERADVPMEIIPRVGESLSIITDFCSFGGRVVDVHYVKDHRESFKKYPIEVEITLDG